MKGALVILSAAALMLAVTASAQSDAAGHSQSLPRGVKHSLYERDGLEVDVLTYSTKRDLRLAARQHKARHANRLLAFALLRGDRCEIHAVDQRVARTRKPLVEAQHEHCLAMAR